jgi:hypothetical protein
MTDPKPTDPAQQDKTADDPYGLLSASVRLIVDTDDTGKNPDLTVWIEKSIPGRRPRLVASGGGDGFISLTIEWSTKDQIATDEQQSRGLNPYNVPRRQAPVVKAPTTHWIDRHPKNGGSGIGGSDQG